MAFEDKLVEELGSHMVGINFLLIAVMCEMIYPGQALLTFESLRKLI